MLVCSREKVYLTMKNENFYYLLGVFLITLFHLFFSGDEGGRQLASLFKLGIIRGFTISVLVILIR